MVALALSAIVVVFIAYAWRFIEQHATVQSRKAFFYAEAKRVTQSVAGEIRACKEVLKIGDASITFRKNPGGDTVSYEFNNAELTRNGVPVVIVAPTGHFDEFTVSQSQSGFDEKSARALLDMSIAIVDNFGDTSRITSSCAVSAQE